MSPDEVKQVIIDHKEDDAFWRLVISSAIIVVLLVVAVMGIVVGVWAHRADQTARGLVQSNCVIIHLVEKSAFDERVLISKLPKHSPTKSTRVVKVQETEQLARDLRRGVTCEPFKPPTQSDLKP